MKKILLTLALAFCCAAGQGQTTAKPADVNIQELNTKWAKFTQYAEQKQINKAVEEGIRISTLFTQNRQYKEAFATCRQMDALIYYNEQEKKSPEYKLRFMVGKERLRMYTNLKNTEQCKILLKQLHSYTDQLKSDSLQEELLMTEANYYQTFGMTDKSLECYNILFQKRSAGKDEKGIDQCYKDMLGYAEQNNNAPLAIAMRKLYTSWQDSIKAVKTANELNTLQQKYETSQKTLQEKEDKITTNLIIIIALCVLSAILAAGLLFLATLLFKHIRQVKKLKHSLQIANENNEQKSKFIGNISAQIEPSLNTIDEATKETISTPILHENIKALKELMTAIQTYISLEELDMECQEKINEDMAYALSYLSIYNNQLNVPKMHREMNNLMIIYGLSDMIYRGMTLVKFYAPNGVMLSEILHSCFCSHYNKTDVEVQQELGIGRTSFYKMKKQALGYLGFYFYEIVVPQAKDKRFKPSLGVEEE